jgi:hypothetical protein
VAAAQQNVTTSANQDEVASANQGEPAPAKQDESAPTKQENAAFEQDQAEPALWPSAPWLAEPIASQSQPAPRG